MSFAIRWEKEAEDDFANGLAYYLEVGGANLYYRFFKAVNDCIGKLSLNPQHFGYEKHPFRSILLEKFPYKIIFEIEADTIVIYQLFHSKQNPSKLHFNG